MVGRTIHVYDVVLVSSAGQTIHDRFQCFWDPTMESTSEWVAESAAGRASARSRRGEGETLKFMPTGVKYIGTA